MGIIGRESRFGVPIRSSARSSATTASAARCATARSSFRSRRIATERCRPWANVRDAADPRLRIAAWTRTLPGDEPEAAVRRAHGEAVALCLIAGPPRRARRVEPVVPPGLDGAALGAAILAVLGATVARLVESADAAREYPVQRHELESFTWATAEAFTRSRGER